MTVTNTLATVQSGMFRGQSRISKYGNACLRRTLWMAGQAAVLKRTNSFRDKFERYISKDRHNAHPSVPKNGAHHQTVGSNNLGLHGYA